MYVKALERPKSLYGAFDRRPDDHRTTHYCPGCGHGNLHKYIAEAIDELGVQDRTVLVNSVGCSVFAYYYFDVGNVQVAHGRAPAAATALKRALPESIVISYQGDGDLAAIGGNEILHAANRGENITVFFVNNAIYGMTGGQMAPTTVVGQRTSTSPEGRAILQAGFPLRVCELLATLEGPTYIERCALYDNKSRMRARKAVRKALQNQIEGRGFSLIEVLSPCPTGWGLTPGDACEWVRDALAQTFPLGIVKDCSAERAGWTRYRRVVAPQDIPEILGVHPGGETGPPATFHASGLPACDGNRIKVAGFGGQGVLFLGKLLAEVGMAAGFHVSWLPSYGPEMRGGTANCHINISTRPVGSPVVSDPSLLIALNRPSLEKFEAEVAPGGVIIYDSSLIHVAPSRQDVETVAIPVTEIADRLGNAKIANMVALGAFTGLAGLFDRARIEPVVRAMTKRQEFVALNLEAIEAGASYVGTLRRDADLWAV